MPYNTSPLLLSDRTRQFAAMRDGYRASGGLATSPELLALWGPHCVTDVAMLARWIVARSVVSFEWQSETWFPLFQFRPPTLTPSIQSRPLLVELAGTRSRWELANWLITPNGQLCGQLPLALLESDGSAVLRAARGGGLSMPAKRGTARICRSA